MIDKHSEVLLNLHVDPFSLTICLRMESCGRSDFDAKKTIELLSEGLDKLSTPITDDLIRQTMVPPNMVPEKSGILQCSDFLGGGGNVDPLGDSVHSNPDRVKAIALGKSSNEVHSDH